VGKKRDIKQIEAVAKEFGMGEKDRKQFGKYIESEKALGYGGTQNERGDFTYEELQEKAREFLGLN
jgi:hypothetical protein